MGMGLMGLCQEGELKQCYENHHDWWQVLQTNQFISRNRTDGKREQRRVPCRQSSFCSTEEGHKENCVPSSDYPALRSLGQFPSPEQLLALFLVSSLGHSRGCAGVGSSQAGLTLSL